MSYCSETLKDIFREPPVGGARDIFSSAVVKDVGEVMGWSEASEPNKQAWSVTF